MLLALLSTPAHAAGFHLARAELIGGVTAGVPEAGDAAEILAQLGEAVDLILDGGPAHGGPPSTVVDCTRERPAILRLGAIPLARVVAVLDAAGVEHDLG